MPPCALESPLKKANPLMALVDAASLLDSSRSDTSVSAERQARLSSTEQDNAGKTTSRPQTPTLMTCPSPATSVPVSPSDRSLQLLLSHKKNTFAEQLMAILDNETYANVLAWMPDGKAFTIVDPKTFTKEHMPRLFNIRNMSSFVRKLSRWGFSRVHEKATLNSDIFKHKNFQRGNQDLCAQIKWVGRSSSGPVSTAASPSVKMIHKMKQATKQAPPPASKAVEPSITPRTISPIPSSEAPLPAPVLASLRQESDSLLQALALRHLLEQQQQRALQEIQVSQWIRPREKDSMAPYLAQLRASMPY